MATPVPQKDDVDRWTVEQVAAWLQQVELSECSDTFLRKGIDGHKFLQLSEEDLFLWGRDVSIRNRKRILQLVSLIKNLQQHPFTIRSSVALNLPHTTYDDDDNGGDDDDDDYDDDEFDDPDDDDDMEEQNAVAKVQPDCPLPMRPPLPIPRCHQKEEEGEECEEELYLRPIEPSPPSKGPPGPQQPPQKIPWNQNASRTQNSGRGPAPLPGERGPAPPTDHFTTSLTKMSSDSQPLPPRPRVINKSPFQGRNNNQTIASENGRSGGIGGSFLHRHQDSKASLLPKPPRTREIAWTPSLAQEKNDHVYEIVDSPVTSCELQSSETPNSEFDDQDQSRQPEAAAIFPKKPPPLLPQKPAGRNDPNLRQPSASGSPSQIARNRPPKAKGPHALPVNGSQLNLMTSHQESQPYVTLDDGKRILITPLYQKIMDKPYFHFISRDKAKTLMMQGDDGMFLIRPSTHSGEQLTLALRANNKTYNVSIRQRPDGLFALGSEKTLEKVFSSIDELTSTHKRDPIKLENGKLAFLIHTPPKKGSIYVKHYPPGLGKK